jgi:hypothetical protein
VSTITEDEQEVKLLDAMTLIQTYKLSNRTSSVNISPRLVTHHDCLWILLEVHNLGREYSRCYLRHPRCKMSIISAIIATSE